MTQTSLEPELLAVKLARKTGYAEGRENGFWIGVCAGLLFSILLYWSFQ